MFSLSVFKVLGGWGIICNEKYNNWMVILFTFFLVRRSAQQVLGYKSISMHLISQLSEVRRTCTLSMFYTVLCEQF